MTLETDEVKASRVLRTAPAVTALIVGAVAFALFFNFHLHKLHFNGYLTDEGWINGMVWRKPRLDPLAFEWAGSFYNVHVSPLLSLASFLSYTWPFDKTSWLASFFSAPPAMSVGLFVFIAMKRFIPLFAERHFLAAAIHLLPIPVAVSGAFAANTGYPHFEIWAVSLLAFATYNLLEDRLVLAGFFLLMSLTVREDIGTYVAVACLSMSVFGGLPDKKERILRYCALVCGVYSIGVTLIRARLGGSHSLETSLFGDPFLGHLNTSFIRDRLQGLSTSTSATLILMPLALTVILAVIQRNRIALCLTTLALPQMAISLIAVFPTAGLLDLHYGFPVTTAVCAAFVALLLSDKKESVKSPAHATSVGTRLAGAYIGAVAIFGALTTSVLATSFGNYPSLTDRHAREQAIRLAVKGGLKIDPALAALEPDAVPITSLAGKADLARNCSLISLTATFDGSQVVPTVGLAAAGPKDGLPEGLGIVNPGDGCQIPTSNPYYSTDFVYLPIRLPSETGRIRQLERVATEGTDKPGFVSFGPYASLPKGKYRFIVDYRSSLDRRRVSGNFGVTGGETPAAKTYRTVDLLGTEGQSKRVSFNLTFSDIDANNLELRVFWEGSGSITISRVQIRPLRG